MFFIKLFLTRLIFPFMSTVYAGDIDSHRFISATTLTLEIRTGVMTPSA